MNEKLLRNLYRTVGKNFIKLIVISNHQLRIVLCKSKSLFVCCNSLFTSLFFGLTLVIKTIIGCELPLSIPRSTGPPRSFIGVALNNSKWVTGGRFITSIQCYCLNKFVFIFNLSKLTVSESKKFEFLYGVTFLLTLWGVVLS